MLHCQLLPLLPQLPAEMRETSWLAAGVASTRRTSGSLLLHFGVCCSGFSQGKWGPVWRRNLLEVLGGPPLSGVLEALARGHPALMTAPGNWLCGP